MRCTDAGGGVFCVTFRIHSHVERGSEGSHGAFDSLFICPQKRKPPLVLFALFFSLQSFGCE